MYGLICLYGFLRSMCLPRQALLALVVVDFNRMFSQRLIKHNKIKIRWALSNDKHRLGDLHISYQFIL